MSKHSLDDYPALGSSNFSFKTELKFKFLQYLNQQKQNQGFTKSELLNALGVIIVVGILAVIALPIFLG